MDASRIAARADTTRMQQIGLAALGLGMTLAGLYLLENFLRAMTWAAIFAIAVWPLYVRAQRRWPPGRHDVLLPSVFTLLVALVFLVPLVFGGIIIGRELASLYRMGIEWQKTGIPLPDAIARLPFGADTVSGWWTANLGDPASISELLGRLDREQFMAYSHEFGSQMLHRAVIFGFTILTVFFLFKDGENLARQMLVAATRAFGHRGGRLGAQLVASVHGTVDGLVLVGIGEGVLIGIAYAVAGVPHFVLFGAATAVAAMVPFGAPLVFGAASLILVAKGATGAAIAVFAFGFVVAFVADHMIRPALIGGATRLPFLWVLFGILGGVETFGLLGLFVGPAIMAALILLWREWTAGPADVPAAALAAIGPGQVP